MPVVLAVVLLFLTAQVVMLQPVWQAGGGGSIDVSYSVERINNVNYVSAAEFERGMAQAAKRGAEMGRRGVYSDLVNKRSVRSRVGV